MVDYHGYWAKPQCVLVTTVTVILGKVRRLAPSADILHQPIHDSWLTRMPPEAS